MQRANLDDKDTVLLPLTSPSSALTSTASSLTLRRAAPVVDDPRFRLAGGPGSDSRPYGDTETIQQVTSDAPETPRPPHRVLAGPVLAHLHREFLVHEEAARVLEQRAEKAPQWEAVRLRARAAERRQSAARLRQHIRTSRSRAAPHAEYLNGGPGHRNHQAVGP